MGLIRNEPNYEALQQEKKAKEINDSMGKRKLDDIGGDENQDSLRYSIEKIIALKKFMENKKITAAEVNIVNQQDILIEQNFVIIRLLNGILQKM